MSNEMNRSLDAYLKAATPKINRVETGEITLRFTKSQGRIAFCSLITDEGIHPSGESKKKTSKEWEDVIRDDIHADQRADYNPFQY